MAVVNVQEGWSQKDGEQSLESEELTSAASAVRAFTVLCDDATTAVTDALAAGAIPARGAAHPVWGTIQMVRKRGVPRGPLLIDVFCEYSGQESPLARATKYHWGTTGSMEGIDRDVLGDLIKNAAGDRITGLTADFRDPVLAVNRVEAAAPTAAIQAYLWNPRTATNADVFYGAAAGLARMIDIASGSFVQAGVTYWDTTYQIQFRGDSWVLRTLNEGPRYLTDATHRASVKDLKGVEKARLAADGTLLAEAAADVWLDFVVYPSVAFGPLAL